MSDDNSEVLRAIDGLGKLVEAKHKHLDDKIEMMHEDVSRNQKSIGQLFDRDREQSKEIGEIEKTVQPAISHARDSKKWTAAIFVATLATIGTAFGKGIIGFFKGGA